MDVAWSAKRISVIKKGVLRPIFSPPPEEQDHRLGWEQFLDRHRQCGHHGGFAGRACVGSNRHRTGASPYDLLAGPSVHYGRQRSPAAFTPSGPGKCLAIGAFGPYRRLWLALIQRPGGRPPATPQVEVFHEATRLPHHDCRAPTTIRRRSSLSPGSSRTSLRLRARGCSWSAGRNTSARRPPAPGHRSGDAQGLDTPVRLPCYGTQRSDEEVLCTNGRLFYGEYGKVLVYGRNEKESGPRRRSSDSHIRKTIRINPPYVVVPWAGHKYSPVRSGIALIPGG